MSKNKVHDFEPNMDFNKLDKRLIAVLNKTEFAIVYFESGQLSYGWYAVLSLRDNRWEKTWMGQRAFYPVRDTVIAVQDSLKSAVIASDQANSILQDLKRQGMFNLSEVKELYLDCELPPEMHPTVSHLILYHDGEVRKVSYPNIEDYVEGCPHVSDWKRMREIKGIFKKLFENTGN